MKIPPAERKIIWERYKTEDVSRAELARQYGVTRARISQILHSDPEFGQREKEWLKPLARTRAQMDIAKEGFEKVVCYALEDGMSIAAIAEAANLSWDQVNRIIKRRKIEVDSEVA